VFLEALEATLPGGRRGETLAPGTRTAPLATSSVFATPTGADEVDDLAETAARTNPHPPASALPARAPAPPPSPPTLAAARAVPSAWMVVVVALIAAAAIAAALSRF
jgi:cell division septation protein DedD